MHCSKLLAVLTITFICLIRANAQHISVGGNDYVINGVNIPWNKAFWDFGNHPSWGNGYDGDHFESRFEEYKSYGINTVRIWLHADGRASPEFAPDGSVTGLDSRTIPDLKDFMDRAKEHNIMVLIVFWSFDMLNNSKEELILDDTKRQSYIDEALTPIVDSLKGYCNLLGWEIINEPEWAIAENPSAFTSTTVPLLDMQKFVTDLTEGIHNVDPGQQVTLGAAKLQFNATTAPNGANIAGNWWSDAALDAAGGSPSGHLDFYQIHYYDNMQPAGHDPFPYTPTDWGISDKPVLIGEVQGASNTYTSKNILDSSYANNWAGILFWSDKGSDGAGQWTDFNNDLLAFRNEHIGEVDFNLCNDKPHAIFIVDKSTACINSSITINNVSSGNITSYEWDFGSGATPATASTPGPHSITYTNPGMKTIELRVSGPDGNDTLTKTDIVSVVDSINLTVNGLYSDNNPFCISREVVLTLDANFQDTIKGTPQQGWGSTTQNIFDVSTDGNINGINNLSTFLQGNWQSSLNRSATFNVHYGNNGLAYIEVNSVSSFGSNTIYVFIDNQSAGSYTFTSPGIFSVPVSAGFHTIRFQNSGTDWVDVDNYGFVGTSGVNYTWYKNGTTITGANSDTYTISSPVENDSFYVRANGTAHCTKGLPLVSDTAILLEKDSLACILGINENNISTYLHVYPNPSTNHFTLSVTDPSIIIDRAVIYNTQSQQEMELLLFGDNKFGKELPPGLFIIQLFTNKGVVTKKIIKQ